MLLEVKNQESKNDWMICTLKFSKRSTCEIFRGWNKQSKDRLMCLKVLKHLEISTIDDFSCSTTPNEVWVSFSCYKTLSKVWQMCLEVKLHKQAAANAFKS